MLYSFTYGLGLYIQLILTERYPSWIISILIWQYFVFFIHPGLIRHDFHEEKFSIGKILIIPSLNCELDRINFNYKSL